MRRFVVSTTLLLAAGAIACSDQPPAGPETFTVPVFARGVDTYNFGTPMTGDEEVPAVPGPGVGQATFTLSSDGTSVHYRVVTTNVHQITQSHIHIGQPGVNGPIVVFLYGFNAAGTENAGILAEGDFTAANLIARPAIGFGATMAELVAKLRTGGAYVNVHTIPHPGGEIRGQIEERGPTR